MKREYENQVQLLVNCLPVISEYDCFALKGGTAINLFYRNLPRLSVDIDLAYIKFSDRKEAFGEKK
jgi:predicted nucleotidyltransferase component of viral defense system